MDIQTSGFPDVLGVSDPLTCELIHIERANAGNTDRHLATVEKVGVAGIVKAQVPNRFQ